jgi:lycopene cyclase domain-containing protein
MLAALACVWFVVDGTPLTLAILAGLCSVVVIFTFPWDNWAVEQGIWDFPDDRLLFRVRRLSSILDSHPVSVAAFRAPCRSSLLA